MNLDQNVQGILRFLPDDDQRVLQAALKQEFQRGHTAGRRRDIVAYLAWSSLAAGIAVAAVFAIQWYVAVQDTTGWVPVAPSLTQKGECYRVEYETCRRPRE